MVSEKIFFIILVTATIFSSVTSQQQFIRPCYFTDWAHYRPGIGKYDTATYTPELCTHILFAFGKINNDFTPGAFDPADLPSNFDVGYFAKVNALKQQQPDLKTLLSFGGDSAGTTIFKQMTATSQTRQKFINSAINFINQYGFDGIDIDWEFPDSSDKSVFTAFIRELKQAAGNKLVTIAVSANTNTAAAGYDIPNIAPYLDFVNVMTYDFHGTWELVTGENSPLFSAPGDTTNFNSVFSMNYWSQQGMPKQKLLMGIATYGRGWQLNNPNNNGIGAPGIAAPAMPFTATQGFAAYYEICTLGGTRIWDNNQKVPYIVSNNNNLWYGYDDVQSISTKMQWIKQNGFGGAFVWTLDFDDFTGQCGGSKYPLINAIKNGLSNGGGSIPQSTNQTKTTTTTTTIRQLPSQTIKTTTTRRPITQNPNQPFSCPSPNGFFPDPMDCSRYYECVNGNPFGMLCPSGLQWNQAAKACDWPGNVKCPKK